MNEDKSIQEEQPLPFANALLSLGRAMQSITATIQSASEMGRMFAQSLSNLFEAARTITSQISESLGGFVQVAQDLQYNGKLRYLKWPLYFERDQKLIDYFNSIDTGEKIKITKKQEDEIANLVFHCLDEEWLINLQDRWRASSFIEPDRGKLLDEGVALYRNDFYYGSTALMICQVYGIAMAINKFVKKNNLIASSEDKELIQKTFSIIKIDSEKGQMLQLFMNSQVGGFVWYYIAEYFHSEILCSSESKTRMYRHPLRNKICHGTQVNFGTKEHALKAILCIDILIRLGEEIEYTVKLMNEEVA